VAHCTAQAVVRQTSLQQLHADASQLRGIGPDYSGAVEEADVPDRTLADATAGVDEQCIVEAGLYVTSGSRVRLPDGTVVKARDLSGRSGILFRRDSQTGSIDALPNGDNPNWGGLNAALHA